MFLVSSLDLPWSNPWRYMARRRYPLLDPLWQNSRRVMGAIFCVVFMLATAPFSLFQVFLADHLVFRTIILSAGAGAMLILFLSVFSSTPWEETFEEVTAKFVQHLGADLEWISTHSTSAIRNRAAARLEELGQRFVEAHRKAVSPYGKELREAREAYEDAYQFFLRLRLVEARGYEAFLSLQLQY